MVQDIAKFRELFTFLYWGAGVLPLLSHLPVLNLVE